MADTEHLHMQRSDEDDKHLERLVTTNNKNISYGCTEYPDPAIICTNHGCDDEDEQPWGSDVGIANRRDEAPTCIGDDTMPCHVKVTLGGLVAHTNALKYCEEFDNCSSGPIDQLFNPTGMPHRRPYQCSGSGGGVASPHEHPVNSINGIYDWADFHPEPKHYQCCFTTELTGAFSSDVADYEGCYQYPLGNGIHWDSGDGFSRDWNLYILMEFRNNKGAIYAGGDEVDEVGGDLPEYYIPNGLKLAIMTYRTNNDIPPDTICGSYDRYCSGEVGLPSADCPNPEDNCTKVEHYHALHSEAAWSTANIFKGYIRRENYRCYGKNVFTNQIQSPSAYKDPSLCSKYWGGQEYFQYGAVHAPNYIIPYYFGGTVTVEAYNV